MMVCHRPPGGLCSLPHVERNKSTKNQEVNETLCSEDSVSPCSHAKNTVGTFSVVPTDEALPETER
jgi:hypothetical protein